MIVVICFGIQQYEVCTYELKSQSNNDTSPDLFVFFEVWRQTVKFLMLSEDPRHRSVNSSFDNIFLRAYST